MTYQWRQIGSKYVYEPHKKPPMIERDRKTAVIHAMPWVTKEMLTGARAPVAKVKA